MSGVIPQDLRAALDEYRAAMLALVDATYRCHLLYFLSEDLNAALRADAEVVLADQRMRLAKEQLERERLVWAAGVVAGEK